MAENSNIIIRNVKKSDAEQYVRLNAKVWRSAYSHFMPEEIFNKVEGDIDSRIKTISESLGQENIETNGRLCLVAIDDNKVIAYAFATAPCGYANYKEQGYFALHGISVDPEYQGHGLGKKLFHMIASEFLKHGWSKMVNGVLKENNNARQFYEKMGGELDTFEQPFEKLGYSFPEVYYTYDLEKLLSKNL